MRRNGSCCIEEKPLLRGSCVITQTSSVHGHSNFRMHPRQGYGGVLPPPNEPALQRRSRTFAPLQKTIQRATVLVHAQRHCGAPAMLFQNEAECLERSIDLVSIYATEMDAATQARRTHFIRILHVLRRRCTAGTAPLV